VEKKKKDAKKAVQTPLEKEALAPRPKKKAAQEEPKVPPVEVSPPSPPDRASKLVAQWLRPSEKPFAIKPIQQPSLDGPRSLERPELLLPPFAGQVVRSPPLKAATVVRPRALPEESPLARLDADLGQPERISLAAGPLVRVPAPDVNLPPPLPILAQPQPDRAALADPTTQASREAALAESIPSRTAPAPFDRPGIPDPFENRRAVRVGTAPPAAPAPIDVIPRTPPKSLGR
jgi:hypothetical protein